VPHSFEDCEEYPTQVEPLQQPLGQELALHTHWPLALHAWPDTHAAQLAPPVPQDDADCAEYAVHVPPVPPLQQPLGQVLVSHEHVPLVVSHRPLAHAAHAWPPVPHWLADSDA
jgi:hypothetical protein